jgi:hypothetical protein
MWIATAIIIAIVTIKLLWTRKGVYNVHSSQIETPEVKRDQGDLSRGYFDITATSHAMYKRNQEP